MVLLILLLTACSQDVFRPIKENKEQKDKISQGPGSGTTASPGAGVGGNSPGGTVEGDSSTSGNPGGSSSSASSGGSSDTAGGVGNSPAEEGGTVGSDNIATQKAAPWSVHEDYEYRLAQNITGDYADVKVVLRNQIVPQAVKSLLDTFPKTFGYLADWAIGFGMNVIYNDYNTTTEALFELSLSMDPNPKKSGHSTYGMMLNTASPSIDLSVGNALSVETRKRLEALCVHELMHAMMYETHTCGMSGYTPEGGMVALFPEWFKEGTAEAACGGRLWKTIIKPNYTADEIRQVLEEKTLTGNNPTSQYSVGWFAVMYLAYLTKGGASVSPADLADGLDIFLLEIHSGASLSEAIKKYSKGKYSGLQDFEARFVSDDEAVGFVKKLVDAVGSGQGSLVAKDYAATDLLPDESHETMLFWVHFESPYSQLNKYGNSLDSYEILEGGAATYTGVPGAAVNPPTPEVLE